MDLDSMEWDDQIYTLSEFMNDFEFPQIVCVRDGYFDLEEITTLSTDQVMTLHYVKNSRMLKGLSEIKQDEQLSIPTKTKGTFQLLSDRLPKMYKSVKPLKNDSGKMIMSLHSHAWLGIKEKDVLMIKGLKKRNSKEFLHCSLVNREGDVEIPFSYEACFQAYEEPERVEIRDVELHCSFPCTVKMQGRSPIKANVDERSESLDLRSLGRIKLLGVYEHVTLIASIRDKDRVSVMQVPVDLEITVVAAKGAKQKDKTYESFCKEIHETTQFQQMNGLDLDYVKMGNEQKSVDNIYDYIDFRYLDLTKEKSNTPPPPPPPSTALKPKNVPAVPPKPRTLSMDSNSQASTPSATTGANQEQGKQLTEFKIPDSLENLSVDGVADCLRYLHMDTYVEKFQEELIDGQMLVELNEEMMRESLGVTNKLHQKKLRMLVKGWRPK